MSSLAALYLLLFGLGAVEPGVAPSAASAGTTSLTASVDIQLDLPAQLAEEAATLVLRRRPSKELLERRELEAGSGVHRFEALPPGVVDVEVTTSAGPFAEAVDLGPGEDALVVVAPDLVRLWGRVSVGDEGVPAAITFTTTGRQVAEVESDEYGEYEVAVLDGVRMASVELLGSDRAPFVEFFFEVVDSPRRLDLELPGNRLRINVRDAVTGEGIAGAELGIGNRYLPEGESDPERYRKVGQNATADEDGVAELPPMRAGTVEITARAEGYVPQAEALVVEVAAGDGERDLEVELAPLGEAVELSVILPSGAPASGAEVIVARTLDVGSSVYTGTAGADGRLEVPRAPTSAYLLVRHPGAGFVIRRWAAQGRGPGAESVTLPAAAAALTLAVVGPAGEVRVPRAGLALWVGGHRLSGHLLGWLTRSRPFTDMDGYWVGTGLPVGGVGVLAWERTVAEAAGTGALDPLAVEVGYPWTGEVEVRAVR